MGFLFWNFAFLAVVEKVRQPVDKEALAQRLKEMHPNAQAEGILATIGYVERMVAKEKDRSFFERMLSESEKGGNVDQIRGAKITLDCYKLIAKAPEPEKPAAVEKPKEAPKEEKPKEAPKEAEPEKKEPAKASVFKLAKEKDEFEEAPEKEQKEAHERMLGETPASKKKEAAEEKEAVAEYECPVCGSMVGEDETECPGCFIQFETEEGTGEEPKLVAERTAEGKWKRVVKGEEEPEKKPMFRRKEEPADSEMLGVGEMPEAKKPVKRAGVELKAKPEQAKPEGLADKEWDFLKRMGAESVKVKQFGDVESKNCHVVSDNARSLFISVKMKDGTECALTRSALKSAMRQESEPEGEIQRKFYTLKTFTVHKEPTYRGLIKGPFGAVLHAHVGAFVDVAQIDMFHPEESGVYTKDDKFRKEGAWSVQLGKHKHYAGERLQEMEKQVYYVTWSCVVPHIDDDPRPGPMSYIQVGVLEEDFKRIKAVLEKNPKRIREVMAGIFPELAAVCGMGMENSGMIEYVDETAKGPLSGIFSRKNEEPPELKRYYQDAGKVIVRGLPISGYEWAMKPSYYKMTLKELSEADHQAFLFASYAATQKSRLAFFERNERGLEGAVPEPRTEGWLGKFTSSDTSSLGEELREVVDRDKYKVGRFVERCRSELGEAAVNGIAIPLLGIALPLGYSRGNRSENFDDFEKMCRQVDKPEFRKVVMIAFEEIKPDTPTSWRILDEMAYFPEGHQSGISPETAKDDAFYKFIVRKSEEFLSKGVALPWFTACVEHCSTWRDENGLEADERYLPEKKKARPEAKPEAPPEKPGFFRGMFKKK